MDDNEKKKDDSDIGSTSEVLTRECFRWSCAKNFNKLAIHIPKTQEERGTHKDEFEKRKLLRYVLSTTHCESL